MGNVISMSPPRVIRKGTKYQFMQGDDVVGSLDVITFTMKDKMIKDLKKMRWFLPKQDFVRSELEIPKDEKGLETYKQERTQLNTWGMVVMYRHAGDKDDIAKRMCADTLGRQDVPEIFVNKFKEILDEFSDILTKFIGNGDN